MAAENRMSFDDLSKVSTSNDDYDDDEPTVKLDGGEAIVAEVRHIEHGVGKWDNTVLHLTRLDLDGEAQPVRMWSNATIDRALDLADVGPGDVIGIRKSEERYTYTTDDGEEREAYDFEVGVRD